MWRKCKCRLTPTTLYDREKGLHMETERDGVGSEMTGNTSACKVTQLVWWEQRSSREEVHRERKVANSEGQAKKRNLLP